MRITDGLLPLTIKIERLKLSKENTYEIALLEEKIDKIIEDETNHYHHDCMSGSQFIRHILNNLSITTCL